MSLDYLFVFITIYKPGDRVKLVNRSSRVLWYREEIRMGPKNIRECKRMHHKAGRSIPKVPELFRESFSFHTSMRCCHICKIAVHGIQDVFGFIGSDTDDTDDNIDITLKHFLLQFRYQPHHFVADGLSAPRS